MVTVTNYKTTKNSKGETFNILELQGGVEMIKSVKTDKFYAHAHRATITSTLNEATCKALVGTKFPGSIKKVESDPYSYTIPGTTDAVTLNHSYQYVADGSNVEETIFQEA